MTAENCLCILKERLSKFDISLETDIVAIVTDAPNVMIKVGRLVCGEQQLCLAHGVNLAVCDVLYKKHTYLQHSPTLDDTVNEPVVAVDYMDDNNDDDLLEDLDCSKSGLILMSQNYLAQERIPELTQDENINELIEKVFFFVFLPVRRARRAKNPLWTFRAPARTGCVRLSRTKNPLKHYGACH
ncbi:hypothetical protein EVAR_93876_1 [Eumeta japonica]|uniref:Uncharacterized protein n=1 Tax=Eumeta variegata TaxID=151549 RepID=A0A4C1TWP2_EUMVA|nr:hypothetical protein EVAR_93876_1 [Eumeta japonica]